MFQRATLVTIASVCLACGGAGDAPPIALHLPAVPACFVPKQLAQALVAGGAGPGATSGNTGIGNFGGNGALAIPGPAPALVNSSQMSFLMQLAKLMITPVLESPTDASWDWVARDPAGIAMHIEGDGAGRGPLSGRLSLRFWSENEALFMQSAALDVDYDPIVTRYDFGDQELRVSDRYAGTRAFEIGCASPDISFSADRTGAAPAECWHSGGKEIDADTCQQIIGGVRP